MIYILVSTTIAHSLYRIMVMATIVVGVMKIGNMVPRAGLECTSQAFWASVLPLHCVGFLMSTLCPCLPVYAAPCLRGPCRHVNYIYM